MDKTFHSAQEAIDGLGDGQTLLVGGFDSQATQKI